MPINALRAIDTFTKAVEFGSLRKAAAAQGVSPQAASQALAQLEQHLGVRLLHRTTRHIALANEGQQFLESTGPAIAMIERAVQGVRTAKDDVAGPLRIVARGRRSCRSSGRWSTRSARRIRASSPTCSSTTPSAIGCGTAPTSAFASARRRKRA